MSKVTFRAKALEHNRKMAIYIGDEIPELTDFAIVNRTVPEMPSGMEKEEETQHHLQKALSAQQACGSISNLIIPIPELKGADHYERIYSTKAGYTVSKKFIHVQPSTTDQELPDYDMDTEDELWLDGHKSVFDDLDSDPVRFENMVDKLEKGSGHLVVKLNEAKALIKEKDDVITAVYDYWLSKRLRQEKLVKELLSLKIENNPILPAPPQSCSINPYLAFRKRAEKMQTRKNRKNDEQSYLGMLQLKKSFEKTKALLEMLKIRESCKKELMETKRNIFEKRFELRDWSGDCVKEMEGSIGPVHLPDLSHLFAQSTLHDDYSVKETIRQPAPSPTSFLQQKYGSNRISATCSAVAASCERPKKKKKYHRRRSQPHRWHDGSDVPSDDAGDDDDDVEMKIRSSANQDTEELERLSRTLSFFKPHSVVQRLPWGSPIGREASGKFSSDNSEDDSLPDGKYTFKRKDGCYYQAPIPCQTETDDSPFDQIFTSDLCCAGRSFSMATMSNSRTTGYMRQRMGRGGRVIIDRISLGNQAMADIKNDQRPVYRMSQRKRQLHVRKENVDVGGSYRQEPDDGSHLVPHSNMDTTIKTMDHDPDPLDIKSVSYPGSPKHRKFHEVIDSSDHKQQVVDIFPEKFSESSSTKCSSATSVISLPLFPSTTARTSRASCLFGPTYSSTSLSGYKRKCSNRTDSEDSGVCSPSPTPSSGSFLGTNSETCHPELLNKCLTNRNIAQDTKNINPKEKVLPNDVDDGIYDDHSNNGDSCSSFSDHNKSRNLFSSSSSDNSRSSMCQQNGSDRNHDSYVSDCKRSRLEVNQRISSDLKIGSQLSMRKHLSSFDNCKSSRLVSIIKDGNLRMGLGEEEEGRSSNALRYQCQLKLANNLISLNGDVITALEVS